MTPNRTTPRPADPGAPATAAQASLYQQLRAHLAVLKLADATVVLPAVLDQATAQHLSVTATLERLLAIEVHATQARCLAGRLRFACLPTPATLEDFDYDAASGVDPHLIADLATGHYLESATNVLMIGPRASAKPTWRSGWPGGLCPHCDEPVAISDLIDTLTTSNIV